MSAEATLQVQPNELMVGCPVLSDPEMNTCTKGWKTGGKSSRKWRGITKYSYENIKKYDCIFYEFSNFFAGLLEIKFSVGLLISKDYKLLLFFLSYFYCNVLWYTCMVTSLLKLTALQIKRTGSQFCHKLNMLKGQI